MWSDEQIRQALNEMLMEVLDVEEEALRPDANFFDDLDGESIVMLELGFLTEKRFGRRIEYHRMIAADALEFDQNRALTSASIDKVCETLPFVDREMLRQHAHADTIQGLLTVENLFRYLRQELSRPAGNQGPVAST